MKTLTLLFSLCIKVQKNAFYIIFLARYVGENRAFPSKGQQIGQLILINLAIKLVNLRNLRCLKKQILLLQPQYKQSANKDQAKPEPKSDQGKKILKLIKGKQILNLIKANQILNLIQGKQILNLIKAKLSLNLIKVILLIRVASPKAEKGKDENFPDQGMTDPKADQGKAKRGQKQNTTKR
ncbi:unnamed protein product [Paramecium primaurelia]|uniref:Uncharacterized protein n=1 Tax=Paramecium primaurelia TaxID=5886 RepID=A0A8S1NLY6_PARPR|nr:unnamed protein product [Paramecium primaurelia]CAD8093166.1 unnamed protein product [Paramecium primaurelia]